MENNRKWIAWGLILLLGLVIANCGMAPSKGQVPIPIRGFISDIDGDPVEGAIVTLRMTGVVSTDVDTTDVDGYYELDANNIGAENGDTVTITAVHQLMTGTETYMVDVDSFSDHNITIETPSVTLFNVVFFVQNQTGVGVADIVVSILHGSVYTNLTTNATGRATVALGIGDYSWSIVPGLVDTYNRTGTFNLQDRDLELVVNIYEPQGQVDELNILGAGLSKNWLIVIALVFAGILVLLFVVLINKKGKAGSK